MAIKIRFDSEGNVINPTMILMSRNAIKIGSLPYYGLKTKFNLNSYSEISFNVNKNMCKDSIWDNLVDFKLVWVRDWNTCFEINVDINEDNSIEKTITAKSLGESELSQINLYNIEINTETDIERDDYVPTVLFNDENHKASLLHRIMEKCPHYDIGHVDDSIANIQRTFSFNNQTICNAFDAIADEINCLFILDCRIDNNGDLVRTVNVYDLESSCQNCGHRWDYISDSCPECDSTNILNGYGEDTHVFISSKNLAQQINFTTSTGEVKNCFKLQAGDDLMTSAVINCNPNGGQYLWYISDEVKTDMSEEMVAKIEQYEDQCDYYQNEYEADLPVSTVNQYNTIIQKYSVYGGDHEQITTPIVGYPNMIKSLYDVLDFDMYLSNELMPTPQMSNTTAAEQAAKLIVANLSPVSVTDLSSLSLSTANNAVLGMAKVIVDNRYKVSINSSTLSNNTWQGSFSVTNYSDDDDTATSNTISIVINDNYENFLKQKIDKALDKSMTTNDPIDIVSLFNLNLADFTNEIKKYSLSRLKSFYDNCQTCLDILIEQGIANSETWGDKNPNLYNELYVPYLNKLSALETETSLRDAEIDTIKDIENRLYDIKGTIQSELNLQSFMGETLWLQFSAYRREDTYQNDNYISDGLSNSELFDKANQFIIEAQRNIFKSANLQHSISSTLNNLLTIEEFKDIRSYFELGNWIKVKTDNGLYRLRLVSYGLEYEDSNNLSVEFSDVVNISDGITDIQSVLSQSKAIASSYSAVVRQAKKGDESNHTVNGWINDGLSLNNIKIIEDAENQNIKLDNNGLLCREYLPMIDEYDNRQLKIINKGLFLSDDNWTTAKVGIGEIEYGGIKYYGVNAEVLIGDIIIGNELHIKDSQGQDVMTVIDGRISTEVTNVKAAAAAGTYEYYDPANSSWSEKNNVDYFGYGLSQEEKETDTGVKATGNTNKYFLNKHNGNLYKSNGTKWVFQKTLSPKFDNYSTITYTDGKASTAESNAKTYAEGQASTAESNAKTYADGKAIEAYNNAVSHVTTYYTTTDDMNTLIEETEQEIKMTAARAAQQYEIPAGITINYSSYGTPSSEKIVPDASGMYYLDQDTGDLYVSTGTTYNSWSKDTEHSPLPLLTKQLDSKIDQTAQNITQSVSATYSTKTETANAITTVATATNKYDTTGITVNFYGYGVPTTIAGSSQGSTYLDQKTGYLYTRGSAESSWTETSHLTLLTTKIANDAKDYTDSQITTTTTNMNTKIDETAGHIISSANARLEQTIGYEVSKNMLELTANSTTKSGITFTVDRAAGTVTVNGTCTASSYTTLTLGNVVNNGTDPINLYLSGGAENGSSDLYLYSQDISVDPVARPKKWDGETSSSSLTDPTTSTEIQIPAGHTVRAVILVRAGTTVENEVFKPMIRDGVYEADPTFEPYREAQTVQSQISEANSKIIQTAHGITQTVAASNAVEYIIPSGVTVNYHGYGFEENSDHTPNYTMTDTGISAVGISGQTFLNQSNGILYTSDGTTWANSQQQLSSKFSNYMTTSEINQTTDNIRLSVLSTTAGAMGKYDTTGVTVNFYGYGVPTTVAGSEPGSTYLDQETGFLYTRGSGATETWTKTSALTLDTTSKANAAKTEAINTASADATSKANAAKSEAITTVANATNKYDTTGLTIDFYGYGVPTTIAGSSQGSTYLDQNTGYLYTRGSAADSWTDTSHLTLLTTKIVTDMNTTINSAIDVARESVTIQSKALVEATVGYMNKNLIPITMNSGTYKSGGANLTYTVDKTAGTITFNGTSRTDTTNINLNFYTDSTGTISGNYYITGGYSSKCYVRVYDSGNGWCKKWNGTSSMAGSTSESNSQEVQLVAGHNNLFRVVVTPNTTLTNAVVKPMLRVPDITDTTFVPYKSTVQRQIDDANASIVVESDRITSTVASSTSKYDTTGLSISYYGYGDPGTISGAQDNQKYLDQTGGFVWTKTASGWAKDSETPLPLITDQLDSQITQTADGIRQEVFSTIGYSIDLIDVSVLESRSTLGITITKQADGSYILNGTSTGAGVCCLSTTDGDSPLSTSLNAIKENGTYTIQGSGIEELSMIVGYDETYVTADISDVEFAVSNATSKTNWVGIYIDSNVTLNNFRLYPIVYRGQAQKTVKSLINQTSNGILLSASQMIGGKRTKNLIPFVLQETTKNGITCKLEGNGYKLTNSSTANQVFTLYTTDGDQSFNNAKLPNTKTLPTGRYIISGTGFNNNIQYRIQYSTDGSTGTKLLYFGDGGDTSEKTFEITDAMTYVRHYIWVRSSTDLGSGVTVKPMIRDASIADDTYTEGIDTGAYMCSVINLTPEKLELDAGKLIINSGNFQIDEEGTVTVASGIIKTSNYSAASGNTKTVGGQLDLSATPLNGKLILDTANFKIAGDGSVTATSANFNDCTITGGTFTVSTTGSKNGHTPSKIHMKYLASENPFSPDETYYYYNFSSMSPQCSGTINLVALNQPGVNIDYFGLSDPDNTTYPYQSNVDKIYLNVLTRDIFKAFDDQQKTGWYKVIPGDPFVPSVESSYLLPCGLITTIASDSTVWSGDEYEYVCYNYNGIKASNVITIESEKGVTIEATNGIRVPSNLYISKLYSNANNDPNGDINLYGNLSLQTGSGSISVGGEKAFQLYSNSVAVGADTLPLRLYGSSIWANNPITTGSDARLKHDIESLDKRYIEVIKNIEPKRFRYLSNPLDRCHTGYIAQEVKEAMDKVGISVDEMAAYVDINSDGSELALRYGEFIPMLHKWIKEIDDRLKAIERKEDKK